MSSENMFRRLRFLRLGSDCFFPDFSPKIGWLELVERLCCWHVPSQLKPGISLTPRIACQYPSLSRNHSQSIKSSIQMLHQKSRGTIVRVWRLWACGACAREASPTCMADCLLAPSSPSPSIIAPCTNL